METAADRRLPKRLRALILVVTALVFALVILLAIQIHRALRARPHQ